MKTYKERQKKETLLTIVYQPVMLEEKDSDLLKELGKFSDLFFIFLPGDELKMRVRKFSNLYGATFYGIGERGQTEQELIWEALMYAKELGGGYTSFSVLELPTCTKGDLVPLKTISLSLIETSVWEDRDLTYFELKKIYLKNIDYLEKLKGLNLLSKILLLKDRKDTEKMYSTKTSTDPILFIREITLDKLKEYFESNPYYYHSFKNSDPREFLSSAISHICPETKINIKLRYAKA